MRVLSPQQFKTAGIVLHGLEGIRNLMG
jgi:hypothetical protein